jgi:hypothetical protein
VIVNDLDVVGISVPPTKADAPLIVDANAMLAVSVAVSPLQPVAGRHTEVVESIARRNGVRSAILVPRCP